MAKEMTMPNVNTLSTISPVKSPEQLAGMPVEELLELDYMALPTIVNDGEGFRVRNGDFKLIDDSFEGVILAAQPYAYHKCSSPEHAMPGFYTYDGETTSSGESVEEIHKMWEEDGCSHTVHDYIGLRVVLVAPEEAFNQLAIVNISPTSVKRVKAYLQINLRRNRRLQPWQAVTRFKLQDKAARGRGGKSFYPWDFEFVTPVDETLAEALAGGDVFGE